MRKSNVVKAMACFMAATMAITCVPSANVTNGVSMISEAAEALKPVLELTFDGTITDTVYTEKELKFTTADKVSIVENPDKATEKVLFIDNGYLTTEPDALSNIDFTKGFSISMDIRPEVQTNTLKDWTYLFGIGTSGDNNWNFMDGTIGFIQRVQDLSDSGSTNGYPGDGWVEGNRFGGIKGDPNNNPFDYLTKEENCKKWYNITYVYAKDKAAMYVDGILTVQYKKNIKML